ncbi:DUF6776 family protein [uncultured Pseudoteredinibacter sp.]|uniref:DUF6776 family protein n=1 Tax=uncultured Pseudoteredinibacter sp. TaxID=1641701 RepID=UPI00261CBE5F|nr:DUF6776 family protein [uncultured Pseudoteredinibacter sp.]
MAVVKGSYQYRLRVVQDEPGKRFAGQLVTTILVLTVGLASYFYGRYQLQSTQADATAEVAQLRSQLHNKNSEADGLRQEVANLSLGSEVDRKAAEDVRGEVIQLKAKIAELEENVSFYRGLMSPTANKRGLTIGSLDVIATSTPRHYQYKLVVQQLASNHSHLRGHLSFNVVGRETDGEVRSFALKDLSNDVSGDEIRLGFRYFQNVTGEMVLPEGFTPERIELVAKSTGRDAVEVEKKFGWLVQQS